MMHVADPCQCAPRQDLVGPNPYDARRSDVVTEPAQRPDAPSLWNPNAAGLWSILLTPTFGSYLLWKNWVEMGEVEKARSAKIWLIISAVLILPSVLSAFGGLVYLVIWYFAFQSKQARYVQFLVGENYIRKGWAKPLLVGFSILFAIIIAFGAMVAFLYSGKSGRY